MNGVAERTIGIIDKLARSMLYQAKASHRLWDYATEHAVWLRNRLRTEALPYGEERTARTPFEAYYSHKPDVSRLRTFGCAAYPLNSIERMPRKYDPRIRGELIFVGMKGNKIWRLLNKETLKEEVLGDTNFNKYLFSTITSLTNKSKLIRI